ncbi:MAG: hypothetical protein LRY35_02665, partial [Clostridiales bacterium]|nr:hypothetical protein [Clostridiales bacterium]
MTGNLIHVAIVGLLELIPENIRTDITQPLDLCHRHAFRNQLSLQAAISSPLIPSEILAKADLASATGAPSCNMR